MDEGNTNPALPAGGVAAPVVEKIAKEYTGKLKVGKVNVDDNAETPTQYGIQGIPTLILFRDGKQVDRVGGGISKEELIKRIKEIK